ncbi:GNAT family N-acetyltransferase [Phenylobacterium sp. 58.2.17]|uniref:GNAT family N-acetyltransferase n=1 Tax=Phenylobacterium sp. 58.2.17 TaxID=2969306 RepID=UPI0022655CD5|nr:GNAT family N-acetyltransferase [Phenylobacterium sp. 58.2.17]MCX7585637.1 GNAT family N-acetyltransferase [Phenylobacterium sp. 58.2.17]
MGQEKTAAAAKVQVRPATPADASLIYGFIRGLAEYEKLLHEVEATQADVEAALFGQTPRAFCDIADADGTPVGFALWFYNYSTFRGRHGIYLEDLFVVPQARGLGAGKALLRRLAQRCQDEGLARLEWSVLDWNSPSIAFYDSLGASAQTEWIVRRLTDGPLKALAEG